MVCCVSMEKRKHDVKSLIEETQGVKDEFSRFLGSKSPWTKKVRYHTAANSNQLAKKPVAKNMKIQRQLRSNKVMKKSLKK